MLTYGKMKDRPGGNPIPANAFRLPAQHTEAIKSISAPSVKLFTKRKTTRKFENRRFHLDRKKPFERKQMIFQTFYDFVELISVSLKRTVDANTVDCFVEKELTSLCTKVLGCIATPFCHQLNAIDQKRKKNHLAIEPLENPFRRPKPRRYGTLRWHVFVCRLEISLNASCFSFAQSNICDNLMERKQNEANDDNKQTSPMAMIFRLNWEREEKIPTWEPTTTTNNLLIIVEKSVINNDGDNDDY